MNKENKQTNAPKRNRPVLPQTTVAQITLDFLKAQERPLGRVIDELVNQELRKGFKK